MLGCLIVWLDVNMFITTGLKKNCRSVVVIEFVVFPLSSKPCVCVVGRQALLRIFCHNACLFFAL